MDESATRRKKIDPKLYEVGWEQVPESEIYSAGRVLNRDLWLGFRKLGVECPFPQVDVHSK